MQLRKVRTALGAVLVAGLVGQARASGVGSVDFTALSLDTSTGYSTREVQMGYQRTLAPEDKNVSLGMETGYITGKIDGLKFDYERLGAKGEFNVGNLKWIGSFGVVNRDATDCLEAEALVAKIGAERVFDQLHVGIVGGQNVYGDTLQSADSTRSFLRGPFFDVTLSDTFSKRLRTALVHHSIFLSDKNRRNDDDISIMYGISTDWPWVWVGLGYEYLQDSIPTTNYWAPRIFTDYGPRFDISAPIYGEFSFATALNLNWYKDVDYGSGFGYYGVAKILYGHSDGSQLSLGVESIQSKQQSNSWRSTSFIFGALWPI